MNMCHRRRPIHPKDVGDRYNQSRQQLKYYEDGYSNHETNGKLDISNERLELLKKIEDEKLEILKKCNVKPNKEKHRQ